jgi:hypothetical protein
MFGGYSKTFENGVELTNHLNDTHTLNVEDGDFWRLNCSNPVAAFPFGI